MPVNQPTAKPTNKVTAQTLAGALITIALFVASSFNVKIPAEVALAGGTAIQFAVAYYVKDDENIVLSQSEEQA